MDSKNYLDRRALGNVAPPLPASVVNYKIPIPTSAPASGGGFLNTLSNIFTKVSNTVQKVAPVVSNVQNTINQLKNGPANNNVAMAYNPTTGAYEQAKPGMSTTTKVLIGAGVVGTVGLLAYALAGKKKK